MLKEFKQATNKNLHKLKEDMTEGFIKNDCEKLEIRMKERINDVAIVLTKEMADRHETKKNFKVIEKELQNLYFMCIESLKKTGQVNKDVVTEAAQFMLYQQTEIISNHLIAEQSQSNSDGEMVIVGEDFQKLSPNK